MKLKSIHTNTEYGKGCVVQDLRQEGLQWVKIMAIDPICRVVTIRHADDRQEHVDPGHLGLRFALTVGERKKILAQTGSAEREVEDTFNVTGRDMHGARAGIKQAEMVRPGPQSFDLIRASAITDEASGVRSAYPPEDGLGTMKGIRQIWVSDAEFETLHLALQSMGTSPGWTNAQRNAALKLRAQLDQP